MPPSTIHIDDLSALPGIGPSLAMLRKVSLATDENELFAAFASRFHELSEVTHIMNVLVEDCPEGTFREMLRLKLDGSPITTERIRAISKYNELPESVPLQQSAVLSALVEGEAPKLARACDPSCDSVLADWLEGPSDLLAVPIFKLGHVLEYVIMAMPPGSRPLDAETLRIGIGNINFMARSIETLAIKNEIEQLHSQLDRQISEIGRVQRSLLPAAWPDDPRFDVATSYEPSEAAGGDYFDHRRFPNPAGGDDLLGIIIADVSGHGPVAAVTMAMFRTAMGATVRYTSDPGRTVPDVNALIYDSLEPGTFVTAFLVAFDPSTGDALCRCCGHNPPRLRRASGAIEAINGEGGPPLGILPEIEVPQQAFTMLPGDTLVLYTDGITEAFSPDHELFGEQRLDAAIAEGAGDPERTKQAIFDAVEAHAAGRPRDDDQTLVIFRYNGPDARETGR